MFKDVTYANDFIERVRNDGLQWIDPRDNKLVALRARKDATADVRRRNRILGF